MNDIVFAPIGYVSNEVSEKKDTAWGEDISEIILNEEYRPGVEGLEAFSHLTVIYYLDKAKFVPEKHLRRRPQNREDMPMVGIFAQRAKDRPNPIGMTSVEIISVSQGVVRVRGLDAIDGTPILDLKPYYPVYDKKEAIVPEWVNEVTPKS